MGIDLEIAIGIVVLTLLGVFLTGPGMWSEKWGWSAFRRKRRRPARGEGSKADTGTRGDSPSGARR
jgi:hypothetical protein